MLKISVGLGIAGAIILPLAALAVYMLIWSVKGKAPFEKNLKKIILVALAASALIGAYLGGVTLGGTRIVNYDGNEYKCSVKKCSEQAVYRIRGATIGTEIYSSDAVYCTEHLDIAKERIHTKPNYAKKEKDPWGNTEASVYAIAQLAVEDKLKNPSSAKFSSLADTVILYTSETWTVKGWVEAENSFGATVRNNFTVKITFSGKDEIEKITCSIS